MPYQSIKDNSNKLLIENNKKGFVIEPQEIILCKAEGNYTTFYLTCRRILVPKSLKDVHNSLPKDLFFRCHYSYIINILHIKEYSLKENEILLSNEMKVPISLRRKKEFYSYIHMRFSLNNPSLRSLSDF